MSIEELFAAPQYKTPQAQKEAMLLPALIDLTKHHISQCADYAKIVKWTAPDFSNAKSLDALPYLPASLFKTHKLQSISDSTVRTTLTSSGTTGQAVSRIVLDEETGKNQARALAAVMREAFGAKRLPLLLIESGSTLKKHNQFNARGAGVLGLMMFGQAPVFALDDDMRLKTDVVKQFLQKHGNAPFLIFGFTFMVWSYFHQEITQEGLDCRQGVLIHSGGWKKLQDEAVDNATFRAALKKSCGLTQIYNFYGMVEQTGSAFLEGEDGFLYPPAFADVIIRDPLTWAPQPTGSPGIVQVLSLVPRSYPGHSILTEDRGVIETVDNGNGGRLGKALRILGRMPKAELRGCSDIHAYGTSI